MNLSASPYSVDSFLFRIPLFSTSLILIFLFTDKNPQSLFCRNEVMHSGLHSDGFDLGTNHKRLY